jgi:hypothetical protein
MKITIQPTVLIEASDRDLVFGAEDCVQLLSDRLKELRCNPVFEQLPNSERAAVNRSLTQCETALQAIGNLLIYLP